MNSGINSSLVEKDKKYFFHPFTALKSHENDGGKIIVEGKGSTLIDSNGNKMLDAMAGLWCVNLGYGNTELADAISGQVRKLSYYHSFSGMGTDLAGQLSEKIISMCPVPMSKVFLEIVGQMQMIQMPKLFGFITMRLAAQTRKNYLPPSWLPWCYRFISWINWLKKSS